MRRNSKSVPRVASGIKLCQVCDQPATIRGLYCSEEHADLFRQRSSESYARMKTFERDKGVCAECGLDTKIVEFSRRKATEPWQSYRIKPSEKAKNRTETECRSIKVRYMAVWSRMIVRLGVPEHLWKSGPLWHSDHILPVYRGGGETGIENRQTLCFKCHQDKTSAESHGRRLLPKHKMNNVLRGKKKNI